MWRLIVDALPVINVVVSSATAIAVIKMAFHAGALVQHVRDIDERVSRLENQRRMVAVHGD